MAQAVMRWWPSLTALNTATLSAQQVNEKLTFSTLHPENNIPSSVQTVEPTGYFENGQYAAF
jgi:hypothetical protein